MGLAAILALEQDPSFSIVAKCGRKDDLAACIQDAKPQVVLELTNADAVLKNVEIIIENNVHPVIGASGLKIIDIERLQKICYEKKLGGIVAPNFSLGAVLMMKYAREIAKYMPHVEIIEMHHDKKLDSPSGTAMRTAEMIAETRKKIVLEQGKEMIPHARGATYHDMAIHSIRLPGLIAQQQIIFGGESETLTLRHDSIARLSFMPGILLACKKTLELTELIYGLENIL
jgi:4-hydroxy-tetrahydrodipicolinate reductase